MQKKQQRNLCFAEALHRCVCAFLKTGSPSQALTRQLILPLSRYDISLRPEGVFQRESFPIVYGM